ncbi:MAG: tyrosine-type recombinase/integrase [Christensenellaceae bacterium]|jgi:integrase
MKIQELVLRTTEALQELGVSPRSAWDLHASAFLPLVRAHESRGQDEFDHDLTSKYIRSIEKRIERGEISPGHYRKLLRGAKRLAEYHDQGKLDWSAPKLTSKFKLNEYFTTLLDEFLSTGSFSPKGSSDAMWVARKYFAWLIVEGHKDLIEVGAAEVQRFMIYCSRDLRSNSIRNVQLYMKKLYCFLSEHGYSEESYEGLLTFRTSHEAKMYPAMPPDDVDAILKVIDRRIPRGKRDYAMILLGTVTGLRAVDIAKLRLTDIDWKNGEIKIIQAKTGMSLALPLTADVGKAIKDYILYGRQETNSDAVFLRLHRPYQGFTNGIAIGDLFDDYCKKAEISRRAFDGKGFHSLRRAVGKNIVTAGIPASTAAQVLGDRNLDSIKKYIALDSHHLKECTLSFTGIEKGGAML